MTLKHRPMGEVNDLVHQQLRHRLTPYRPPALVRLWQTVWGRRVLLFLIVGVCWAIGIKAFVAVLSWVLA